EQKHEEGIVSFAEDSAAINSIQERFGFLSFQGAMGTFIFSRFEPANTLSRVLRQETALNSFIKQPSSNGPHSRGGRLRIGFCQMCPIGHQVIPVQRVQGEFLVSEPLSK